VDLADHHHPRQLRLARPLAADLRLPWERPALRRTVLAHATLSYLFGVVIVAGSVNLISRLFR